MRRFLIVAILVLVGVALGSFLEFAFSLDSRIMAAKANKEIAICEQDLPRSQRCVVSAVIEE